MSTWTIPEAPGPPASTPKDALTWLAIAASAVAAVPGILASIQKIFVGHVTSMLPTFAFLGFAALIYGLPPALILGNVAAHRLGGRRGLRCLAITGTILGALIAAWWLTDSVGHPSPRLHGDGTITFSFWAIRARGVLALVVCVMIPTVVAWILLRPLSRRPGAGRSAFLTSAGDEARRPRE